MVWTWQNPVALGGFLAGLGVFFWGLSRWFAIMWRQNAK